MSNLKIVIASEAVPIYKHKDIKTKPFIVMISVLWKKLLCILFMFCNTYLNLIITF
jgi:hypothetical protein